MERQTFYATGPNRIRLLKEKGRFAEAAEAIRRGLEKNPHDFLLKTSLADLYLREGRLTEGRILAEEVLAHDPSVPNQPRGCPLCPFPLIHLPANGIYEPSRLQEQRNGSGIGTNNLEDRRNRRKSPYRERVHRTPVSKRSSIPPIGINATSQGASGPDLLNPFFRPWLYRKPPF